MSVLTKKILITCPKGVVPFLTKEVTDAGYSVTGTLPAAVALNGTLNDCIRLNLRLRTANRVLWLVQEFSVNDPDDLYRKIHRIPWENILEADTYLSIASHVEHPLIDNTMFANQKCKDAVVDRLREQTGRRPATGPGKDKAVLFLFWRGTDAAVYIDTSGESIARHGYRKIPFKAPLQEGLAAALIMATAWDVRSHFINPMCGSGTLAIEAALMALNRYPGLYRDNFGFMHVKGYDREAYKAARESLLPLHEINSRIIATDKDPEAIRAARKNAVTAGVEKYIEFSTCGFSDTPVPEGNGVVILNPEYGERMGEIPDLEITYKAIGDFFKQKCKGYTGYIFTGNPELAKKIGLKAKKKTAFFNADIECRLMEYELYEGSRR